MNLGWKQDEEKFDPLFTAHANEDGDALGLPPPHAPQAPGAGGDRDGVALAHGRIQDRGPPPQPQQPYIASHVVMPSAAAPQPLPLAAQLAAVVATEAQALALLAPLRQYPRQVLTTKRAAQNRNAQRAFRQRKEKYIKELEAKAAETDVLKQTIEELKAENMQLRDYTLQLQLRVIELGLAPSLGQNAVGASEAQAGMPPPPPPLIFNQRLPDK